MSDNAYLISFDILEKDFKHILATQDFEKVNEDDIKIHSPIIFEKWKISKPKEK